MKFYQIRKKKQMYDTFGSIDAVDMPMGGANFTDIGGLNDLLKDMFGRFETGFSFHNKPSDKQKVLNEILVNVKIEDLFYGKKKSIEKEILCDCVKCKGTGAEDEKFIFKCLNCDGKGFVVKQITSFMQHTHTCPSCMGTKQFIKRKCPECQGEKLVKLKKAFEFNIPKNLRDGHRMMHNNTMFIFKYDIDKKYKIDSDLNVHYNLEITLEELLRGFSKNVIIYEENFKIISHQYFNPTNKRIIVNEKGLFNNESKKHSDLIIHFTVQYNEDCEKFIKYNELFKKIFKEENINEDEVSKYTEVIVE